MRLYANGALRDFLKTHFQPFHLSYPPIHYSILLLTPISRPSPSSPIIPAIHSYYHPCSLCIHSHLSLLLSHFHHTHSYPFPFQSSHSIPFHYSHSFPILLLNHHSNSFSGINALHYPPLSFILSIPILIPLSSILHIPFMSFASLLIYVSLL